MKRNPKQAGSALFDCIPQEGKCPVGCNQCFYNRPGTFYTETPLVPSIDEINECCFDERIANDIGTPIVRMNCGHDSNIERDKVIEVSKRYPEVFFNTSIPKFDFPGPVVWTANPKEWEPVAERHIPRNVMFIRLRVSSTNIEYIKDAVEYYSDVPIVLTFMAYYDGPPEPVSVEGVTENYIYQVRHVNSYWCPKDLFVISVRNTFKFFRNVHLCGKWCKDCRNCETFYWQTRNKNAY